MKTMRMRVRRNEGFTLIELLVVIAIIGILAGLLLPSLAEARRKAHVMKCVSDQRQIMLGMRMFADDNAGRLPMQMPLTSGGALRPGQNLLLPADVWRVFEAVGEPLGSPAILVCPSDEARAPATSFQSQNLAGGAALTNNLQVSYGVPSDPDDNNPQMFLLACRNIFGPSTAATANGGYGNSPSSGTGALVALGTNATTTVGWTARLHRNAGAMTFSDGSVQRLSSDGLRNALTQTGNSQGNRIVLP